MSKQTINALENKFAVFIRMGITGLVGKGILPMLLFLVFCPVPLNAESLYARDTIHEFQRCEFVLFDPLDGHTDSSSAFTSQVHLGGIEGLTKFIRGVIKSSDSISTNGKPVSNKKANDESKDATGCRDERLAEQFQNRASIVCYLKSFLLTLAIGIGVGVAILESYYWVRINLT